MKPELRDRRREIMTYHVRGVPVSKWAPALAQKYGVRKEAIYMDYKRMDRWIGDIITLSPIGASNPRKNNKLFMNNDARVYYMGNRVILKAVHL